MLVKQVQDHTHGLANVRFLVTKWISISLLMFSMFVVVVMVTMAPCQSHC